MPTDNEHTPVTERYPKLADIDEQDSDRRLETYRNVLEPLQHELNNNRSQQRWFILPPAEDDVKCWIVTPCRVTPLMDDGPKGRYMTEWHIDPATSLDRLDITLVASGLVESRVKAQRLIKAGHVHMDGGTITEPSFMVKAGHSELAADKGDGYVSRGVYKLLDAFETSAGNGFTGPGGLECLNIGASTGDFTDILLRGGAARVVALDVEHGQLDPRIVNDKHVIEMSDVNIRETEADDLPYWPAMIVSDVFFISLAYVIPVIAHTAAPGAQIALLIRPRFEIDRAGLGKGGIAEDPALRERALHDMVACAEQRGLDVVATTDSPIIGTHGNEEHLLYTVLR